MSTTSLFFAVPPSHSAGLLAVESVETVVLFLPLADEVIHKLHPLDFDDGAILLGKLLGKYAVKSCNIDRARAKSIAFSKGGHPGKILEVRLLFCVTVPLVACGCETSCHCVWTPLKPTFECTGCNATCVVMPWSLLGVLLRLLRFVPFTYCALCPGVTHNVVPRRQRK